ncbi:unnamed protein product, partial [marine sediment metagenome]
ARMRYCGALATVLGLIKTDMDAWDAAAVTIIDVASNSYTRCNLEDDGLVIMEGPVGYASAKCYYDVEAKFTQD